MTRAEIEALIPHAGRMCLLDRAIAWDHEHIHCRSGNHRKADHPLRRRGRLAGVHLVEYAAQAAALHSSLIARDENGAARGGAIAGLRDIRLPNTDLATLEADLDISVYAELRSPQGLIYRFDVLANATELASGRLTIVTG